MVSRGANATPLEQHAFLVPEKAQIGTIVLLERDTWRIEKREGRATDRGIRQLRHRITKRRADLGEPAWMLHRPFAGTLGSSVAGSVGHSRVVLQAPDEKGEPHFGAS